jgi:hypothetical protein
LEGAAASQKRPESLQESVFFGLDHEKMRETSSRGVQNFALLRDSATQHPRIERPRRLAMNLNAEWSRLMTEYEKQHSDPRNRVCHQIGIPLIAASFPVGATILGLPLAVGMFTTGWAFQFAGHYFEGNSPAFVSDKRNLLVGLLWCAKKMGATVNLEATAASPRATEF